MIIRFLENIEKNNLFTREDNILLAISGGMDSVAMAHLFHAAGFNFSLAHCNFGLRGEESEQDEVFVRYFARELNVDFFIKSFDTQSFARKRKISIQMAARELRYEWFMELMKIHAFNYLATAHHADDHTETVLINLTRNTGLAGLKGIRPGVKTLIRPLLYFSKAEIETYCQQHKLYYREDSSNTQTKYIRNKIRHDIVPLLKEINPSLNTSMLRLSRTAEDAEALLDFFISKAFEAHTFKKKDKFFIEIEPLLALPGKELVLFKLLQGYGFHGPVIERIAAGLEGQPGKFYFSDSHGCLRDRNHLVISPIEEAANDEVIAIDQDTPKIQTSSGIFIFTLYDNFSLENISKDPGETFIDLKAVEDPLVLRHPRDGDFFFPFGMSGKKKLSDYLTDKKLPRTDKHKVWVLCSGDNIAWVAGMRPDKRFRVCPGTKNVLKVKFIPQ